MNQTECPHTVRVKRNDTFFLERLLKNDDDDDVTLL